MNEKRCWAPLGFPVVSTRRTDVEGRAFRTDPGRLLSAIGFLVMRRRRQWHLSCLRASCEDVLKPLPAPPRSPTLNLSWTAVVVATTVVLAIARPASAQDQGGSTKQGGELARQIQQDLDREAFHERLWWNAWMATYGGLTIGQGVAGGLSGDHDTRADMGVGAATSFLGVVGLGISRLPEIDAAAKALRAIPSDGEEAGLDRDRAAVILREQAADAEREERSWVAHALNFMVAAGSSLVLWKGFDRGASSAANFGVSLAVGELQIWTQPNALVNGSSGWLAAAPLPGTPAVPRKSIGLALTGGVLQIALAF
jgi:hypothetical protein